MVYMIVFSTGEKLSERNIIVLQNVYVCVYCVFVYSVCDNCGLWKYEEGRLFLSRMTHGEKCVCVKCCYTTRREKNERRKRCLF